MSRLVQSPQSKVVHPVHAILVAAPSRVPEIMTMVVTICPHEETKFIGDFGFLEYEVRRYVSACLRQVTTGPIPKVDAMFYKRK